MKFMTVNEAKKYLEEETMLKDSTMLDFEMLDFAVTKGWLNPIQFNLNEETFFYTPEFENSFGRYKVKQIYRVPDEVIKENLLICPYRYKAELIEAFDGEAKENTIKYYSNMDCAITEITDFSIMN